MFNFSWHKVVKKKSIKILGKIRKKKKKFSARHLNKDTIDYNGLKNLTCS